MGRHLLYVSTTVPSAGSGSSVIFYRHLLRLKGLNVSVLVDDSVESARHSLPEGMRLIKISSPKWRWPSLQRRVPLFLSMRMGMMGDACDRLFKDSRPGAILNLFGKNTILAHQLSSRWGVPLNLVIHDRWQVWNKFGTDRYMTERCARKILDSAARIWPVSRELGAFYGLDGDPRAKVLLPIPEGNPEGAVAWKESYKISPVVGFAGSFHSPQLDDLKRAALILKSLNGRLVIINKKNDLIRSALSGVDNIDYLPPFERNLDVLRYLRDNVSAVLVSGTIDKRVAGWELSFPSRFVEFVHTGLPIIVVAAAGTALSGWLDAREWKGRLASGDEAALSKAVKSILIKEEWERMAGQSRQAAQGEFNPGRIQEQFERELVFKG